MLSFTSLTCSDGIMGQTIENEEPPESAGGCIRFFKRKTHAPDLLAGKLSFTVLALGDSNLLLERQTTSAKVSVEEDFFTALP